MENRFLIDLGVKYGLNDAQVSKVASMAHQAGATHDERLFKRVAEYICETKMVDTAAEEVLEELKRKGLA